MRTVMHIGSVAIAAVFALALVIDSADARRGGGGGGGGMRGGGGGMRAGGGGMRAGGFGGAGMRAGGAGGRVGMAGGPGRPHVSHPIAPGGRPGGGWANRPGGGGNWANRPGYNPGYGYRPGYGWGAAAVGAGLAYGAYAGGYGSGYGYYDEPYPSYSYQEAAVSGGDDAIAECARRFKTYDPATQTYIKRKGVRASCP